MAESKPDPTAHSVTQEQARGQGATKEGLSARARMVTLAKSLQRLALFVVSILLFVVAIELIKRGARGAAVLLGSYLDINNVLNALGFGWFASYLVMSGSPVAAVSVAFLATGALDQLPAFAMIVGSRLGASFIVLFVGFVYVLRGYERRTGLTMGLLSLLVTFSIYLPALGVGALLIEHHVLDSMHFDRGGTLSSILERALQPVVQPLSNMLPDWGVMLVGLAVLWVSFFLFDRVLPELNLEQSRFSRVAHLVYRPAVMFILGGVLTLLTLSVSLSLSLLVPLSARGYIRRENAIPYIMGANITTFVDTLFATVVLGSRDALTVVLVSMVSVALVSFLVLALLFRPYERVTLGVVEWATANNRNLALFMLTVVGVPLVLMLI